MRKIILYVAASLDGYMADSQKSVNWIKGQDDTVEIQDTFTPFFASVDTVIMGRTTYEQIVTELSPEKWPYSGAMTYVLTHRPMADAEGRPITDAEGIRFTSGNPCQLVNELRHRAGKNIWICGGADIISQLLKADLIDVFHIATIPVILGGGVRLFAETDGMMNLRLTNTVNYNGIIEAVYERIQDCHAE